MPGLITAVVSNRRRSARVNERIVQLWRCAFISPQMCEKWQGKKKDNLTWFIDKANAINEMSKINELSIRNIRILSNHLYNWTFLELDLNQREGQSLSHDSSTFNQKYNPQSGCNLWPQWTQPSYSPYCSVGWLLFPQRKHLIVCINNNERNEGRHL